MKAYCCAFETRMKPGLVFELHLESLKYAVKWSNFISMNRSDDVPLENCGTLGNFLLHTRLIGELWMTVWHRSVEEPPFQDYISASRRRRLRTTLSSICKHSDVCQQCLRYDKAVLSNCCLCEGRGEGKTALWQSCCRTENFCAMVSSFIEQSAFRLSGLGIEEPFVFSLPREFLSPIEPRSPYKIFSISHLPEFPRITIKQ